MIRGFGVLALVLVVFASVQIGYAADPGPGGSAPAAPGKRPGAGAKGQAGKGTSTVKKTVRRGKGAAGASGPSEDGKAAENPLVARGNAFLRRGSTGAAAASFRRQLQTSPDSAALNVGLGKALARIGECQEALERLWPYVGSVPFGAEAALAGSTCSSRLGLLEDAVYFDRMAAELDHTSARALTSLALDLSSLGDEAGLEDALDALVMLRADRDSSLYTRAVLALREGDLDTFDVVAAMWEQQDGAGLDLRRLQAQAWLDTDNPVLAVQTLDGVKRLRNGQHVRILRAEAYRRLGAFEEAAPYLEDRPQSVLEGSDSDAVRARLAVDQGDLEAARALLEPYERRGDTDITASRWYLARAEGNAVRAAELAELYDAEQSNPHRVLEQLVPWTAGISSR